MNDYCLKVQYVIIVKNRSRTYNTNMSLEWSTDCGNFLDYAWEEFIRQTDPQEGTEIHSFLIRDVWKL